MVMYLLKRLIRQGLIYYLIDYRLPGNKNGIDIATQILDKFPLAPILFITAHENLHKETSKNPIFDGKNIEVLLKPVKLDKIESSIVALINRNQVSYNHG